MTEIPVEGDQLDGRIKSGGAFIDTGRSIITNKTAKARQDDTVVAEKQFPYKSGNIHENNFYIQK